MSFNFGAKVGEVIKGNLVRGAGGRFTSAADLAAQEQEIRNRVTLRLALARKGQATGGGSLEAAIARIQARFAELDALRAQTNRRGRKPAAPKKAGGGAAGGGSSSAGEKKEENRAKIQAMPPDELNGVDVKAFLNFADGNDISPDKARDLASKGLVEFDDAGQPRLTSSGRGLLAAINAGDRRRVKDALSRAQDKANKQMERYKELAGQADELVEQVKAMAGQIAELEALISQSTDQNEREVLLIQLEKFLAKQASLEESAAKAQARAAEVGRRLGLDSSDEAAEKSLSGFRSSIRASVRGLWNGALGLADFKDAMMSAIERGFNQAWAEGAKSCGLSMDELTDKERDELRSKINDQANYITGFGLDIVSGSKANKEPLQPHFDRAEMWVNRYNEIINRARTLACQDRKGEWVLGKAEHCSSCLKLSGKVKRFSYWSERGIYPRAAGATYLQCRGYKCQCDIVPTDKPMTKGPLPSLP